MKPSISTIVLLLFALALCAAEDIYLERTGETEVKMRSAKKNAAPSKTFDNGDLQIEVISAGEPAPVRGEVPAVVTGDDREARELRAWRKLAEEPIELRVKDGKLYIQWAGERQVQTLSSNMVVRIRLKPKVP